MPVEHYFLDGSALVLLYLWGIVFVLLKDEFGNFLRHVGI